ncbi:hypothetical protein VTO42DRAFT_6713 [Malbranchea cinnamomea]
MPSDSIITPSILIARFLRANNYRDTLSAFIREAGLPQDVGLGVGGESDTWTIEEIIEEKKAFDKTLNFERLGNEREDSQDSWTVPAPSQPTVVETLNPANLLSISVFRVGGSGDNDARPPSVVATSADRRLSIYDITYNHSSVASYTDLADSPILSCTPVQNERCLAMTTMSGKLLLCRGSEILNSRTDHVKYAVQVVSQDEQERSFTWLATAGWDRKIFLYQMNWTGTPLIEEPLDAIELTTNPECILFTRNRDTGDLVLIASRRDSTHLYYYLVEAREAPLTTENLKSYKCRFLGRQNLAPHSNAWVAFSPSYFALSPHDPGLLAVATSTLPHMKVMIVRLLIPPSDEVSSESNMDDLYGTQAFAALSIQNREDAAILVQANAMAPQTPYSTPRVVWRPDGSGIWVNGDDGVVRGMEAKTGKIIATLTGGHEPGSKIRSLWAGWVQMDDGESQGEEWLISGGFDKKLIIWKIDSGNKTK